MAEELENKLAKETQNFMQKLDEIQGELERLKRFSIEKKKASQQKMLMPIDQNIKHVQGFANKIKERESKRQKMARDLKRRLKQMTVAGIISSLIWLSCGGIVIYHTIKCVDKYMKSPKGAEIYTVDGFNEMYPDFTICPHPHGGGIYKSTPYCNTWINDKW